MDGDGKAQRPADGELCGLAKRARARTQAELKAEYAQLVGEVSALEREVRDRELLLAAIGSMKEGIVITDPSLHDNPIVWANERFYTMTGYSEKETLNRNCRFLQGKDTSRDDIKRLSDAIKRREAITLTLRNYRKDGVPFWNELMVAPFSLGGKEYFVALQADITKHHDRLIQYQLRDKALNVCNESVVIADMQLPDQPLIYVNDGFIRMTGYRKDEVLGRNCRFLQGKETDKDAVRRIRVGIEMRATLAVEVLNYRKDGRPFWNQFSLTPIFAPGGKVCTHYIAVQYEHPLVVNGRNQGVEFVSPI